MSLADVMGHAGLAGYAIAAMVLFLLAFVAITLWIFAPWRGREMEAASRLPLDEERGPDDEAPAARGGTAR